MTGRGRREGAVPEERGGGGQIGPRPGRQPPAWGEGPARGATAPRGSPPGRSPHPHRSPRDPRRRNPGSVPVELGGEGESCGCEHERGRLAGSVPMRARPRPQAVAVSRTCHRQAASGWARPWTAGRAVLTPAWPLRRLVLAFGKGRGRASRFQGIPRKRGRKGSRGRGRHREADRGLTPGEVRQRFRQERMVPPSGKVSFKVDTRSGGRRSDTPRD
jgi:hypothetical protein